MKILFAVMMFVCSAYANAPVKQPPQAQKRIVSLLPSNTEILFELGASKIVAVSNFCDYPHQAEKLEKAGDYYNPNIEKIVSLKPDIVFTGPWKNNAAKRLRDAGINVVEIPDATSIADVYSAIKTIGQVSGRVPQADALVRSLTGKINTLAAKNAALKNKPRVYIELDSPHWTAGGGSFLNDMIEKSGGQNIFSDIKEGYTRVSWETVASRRPDVIISLSSSSPDFASLPGSDKIPAVKRQRIITGLDKNLLTRPSPRVYQALRTLSKAIHGGK